MTSENQPAPSAPKGQGFIPRNQGEQTRDFMHGLMVRSIKEKQDGGTNNSRQVAFEMALAAFFLAERDCGSQIFLTPRIECVNKAFDTRLNQFDRASLELSGEIPKGQWSRNRNGWLDAIEKMAEKLGLRTPEPDADYICPQSHKRGEVPICHLKEKSERQRGR